MDKRLKQLSLAILFLMTSCTGVEHFTVVPDIDGSNRIHFNKAGMYSPLLGMAIRHKNGELILDEKEARKEFAKIEDLDDLATDANLVLGCGVAISFKASHEFHKALAVIESDTKKATFHLNEAMKICDSLKETSSYLYLMAYIAQRNGNDKLRNQLLKDFIARSEGAFPDDFFQYDQGAERNNVLENLAMKSSARNAIAGNSPIKLLEAPKGPRMRSNSVYSPGGENTYDPLFFFSVSGNRFESVYGVMYDKPLGFFSIIPTVLYGTESGTYLNVKLRKNLYESYDRSLMFGISAGADEWKQITYTGKALGDYIYDTKATVEKDGYHYFGAFGLTYRPWSPVFGFSTELKFLRLTNIDSNKLYTTGLAFYEFSRNLGIRAGYLRNDLTAEFYLSGLYLGYNFDLEYLNAGVGRTF